MRLREGGERVREREGGRNREERGKHNTEDGTTDMICNIDLER